MSEKAIAVSSDLESNNQLDDKNFNHPIQIRIDYDEVPQGEQQMRSIKIKKKSTYKGTMITLYKAYVGSGVLALPFSFYHGGLLLSTSIYILIASLINYQQVYLLVLAEDARKQCANLDYCKLVELTLGQKSKNACQFFLALMQWGCCISYMIFFLEFFDYAIYHNDTDTPPTLEHQFTYLGLAFLIIMPMTLITNMALFTKISAFSNVLIVFALGIISITALEACVDGRGKGSVPLANVENVSTTIGVGIYAFEAVGIILNVQTSMQKKEKFSRLLQIVTGSVVICCIIFSVISAIGFGEDINQIVLFNLDTSPLMSLVQVAYAVALILSFPLQLFPVFDIVEEITIIKNFMTASQASLPFKRTLIRVIQVVVIGLIALAVPQFAVFLSFLGGMAGSSLQFLFPLLIYYVKLYPVNQPSENYKYCGAMILGILLGTYATINSFIKIVQGENPE